ncbi:hypothetical protein SARC_10551 [Sphaeroforma arctica JP610]|uniref:Uncharacterized protein n=1 Tax=Sphaeroforma arctica JP610 TaxID=667725 RepID=A0A0L0FKH6_9EUKA|nr:hypothetical protein SARC_10551 [Sphaeroforma arctica JP610]KNC76976.1 hypothetical protein SARC_10551 [Sphaeroforma arctica JP610]|eukprot:XP_014150878.1 hypothetical protein SARC_10551 [Sphaeroforma arctica JP610]
MRRLRMPGRRINNGVVTSEIRQAEAHNRYAEESKMWRDYKREKLNDTSGLDPVHRSRAGIEPSRHSADGHPRTYKSGADRATEHAPSSVPEHRSGGMGLESRTRERSRRSHSRDDVRQYRRDTIDGRGYRSGKVWENAGVEDGRIIRERRREDGRINRERRREDGAVKSKDKCERDNDDRANDDRFGSSQGLAGCKRKYGERYSATQQTSDSDTDNKVYKDIHNRDEHLTRSVRAYECDLQDDIKPRRMRIEGDHGHSTPTSTRHNFAETRKIAAERKLQDIARKSHSIGQSWASSGFDEWNEDDECVLRLQNIKQDGSTDTRIRHDGDAPDNVNGLRSTKKSKRPRLENHIDTGRDGQGGGRRANESGCDSSSGSNCNSISERRVKRKRRKKESTEKKHKKRKEHKKSR